MKKGLEQRFMSKVVKAETGCWLWTGGANYDGYGHMRVGDKMYQTHRLSYELFKGHIPVGMFVCHACDCPPCVNPNHLFLGTGSDNMQDKIKKGRHYVGVRSAEERAETMKQVWENYPEEKRKEIAAKISAAKSGVPLSPEHLLSIRRARALPRSEEYRRKLGLAHKGVPSWNKGIPMSEEAKQKLSAAKKGRVPWNKGKKFVSGTHQTQEKQQDVG